MLKSRVLTAIVLIALVLWIIFKAPSEVFVLFIALVMGIAAWEWGGLVPFKRMLTRCVYVIIVEMVLGWIVYLDIYAQGAVWWYVQWIFYANGLCLLAALVAILTYPKTQIYWHCRWNMMCFGVLLLVSTGISLLWLNTLVQGTYWIMSLFLLTWAADTGAYFTGRTLGRRKFLSAVSPNKTWAGFWGGVVLSEIVVLISGFWFAAAFLGWFGWIVTGSLTLLGAVVGDLLVSMLKRCVHLKDTGNILPGHGGVLDRIDSLLVSAYVMTFFVFLIKLL